MYSCNRLTIYSTPFLVRNVKFTVVLNLENGIHFGPCTTEITLQNIPTFIRIYLGILHFGVSLWRRPHSELQPSAQIEYVNCHYKLHFNIINVYQVCVPKISIFQNCHFQSIFCLYTADVSFKIYLIQGWSLENKYR